MSSNKPRGAAIDVGDFCNICKEHFLFVHVHCKKCSSPPSKHVLRNYDPIWRDGDIYCKECGEYVRGYDAG